MDRYVVGIDQGTTYAKVVVVDRDGAIVGRAEKPVARHIPRDGWVEQSAEELWDVTRAGVADALASARVAPAQLEAIGVAGQMGTTVAWNRESLEPVGRAISWLDTRTRSLVARLNAHPAVESVLGGPMVTNASAGKIGWLIENDYAVQAGIARGDLVIGSVSSWLLARLSGGEIAASDYANGLASQLVDPRTFSYHDELLSLVGVPRRVLPDLRPSSEVLGLTDPAVLSGSRVPIAGSTGDVPAAAVGLGALEPGDGALSFGTGAFMLVNTGGLYQAVPGTAQVVLRSDGAEPPSYGLVTMANISGAAIDWLISGMGLISDAAEVDGIASTVPDSGGVYFVPAFDGMYVPAVDAAATGLLIGIGQATTRAHVVRAVLEGMAYQARALHETARDATGYPLDGLRVTGGSSRSDVFMQIVADTLGVPIDRPTDSASSALGAAFLAGAAVGYWPSVTHAARLHRPGTRFEPRVPVDSRDQRYEDWTRAVERAAAWRR